MEHIFHFYDKTNKKNRFYGSLMALFALENTGISLSKAYVYDWDKPFDNYLCTINKGRIIRSTEARTKANSNKSKLSS